MKPYVLEEGAKSFVAALAVNNSQTSSLLNLQISVDMKIEQLI